MPERFESRLSDLYMTETDEPALELTVLTLNINKGYTEKLRTKIRHLHLPLKSA